MQFFIITFREGLEAAIIIGLIYSIIASLGGGRKAFSYLFLGVLSGIVLSIGLFFLLQFLAIEFEGVREKLYEGILMLCAGILITHLIFWAHKKSKHLKEKMKKNITQSLEKNELLIIAMIACVSVAREGIEAVIFLSALDFKTNLSSLVYAVGGLITAVLVSIGIVKIWKSFNIQSVFKLTNIFLIIIAGGLLGHAISEFEGAKLIPTIMKPIFDLRPILSEEIGLGGFLKVAFSYDANPSLSAFCMQFGYIGIMVYMIIKKKR